MHIHSISDVLRDTADLITSDKKDKDLPLRSYERLRNALEKTNDLIFYQDMEWKYHKVKSEDKDKLDRLKNQMAILQQMTLHLGQLQYISCPMHLHEEERNLILVTTSEICHALTHIDDDDYSSDTDSFDKMDQFLIFDHTNTRHRQFFQDKTIVFFAILSIQDLLAELKE